MARFAVSGTKENTLRQLEAKAIEQGGDRGYDERGRKLLKGLVDSIKKATEDVTNESNLSVQGTINQTGNAVSIDIHIDANGPDLFVPLPEEKKEEEEEPAEAEV